MKKLNIALMALALTLSISCKENEKETMDDMNDDMEEMNMDDDSDDMAMNQENSIVVPMGSKSGSNVSGSISFNQMGDEVEMSVNLNGLSEGTHAIHLHENGDCSADDATSAGGHWNPNTNEHGDWDNGSHHMGDIGNLEADSEGNATLTFKTDQWCIDCDDDAKNIKNKAVIVHATADDFTSQPSGAAGARVACGVIK